jgi:hypothetical protein
MYQMKKIPLGVTLYSFEISDVQRLQHLIWDRHLDITSALLNMLDGGLLCSSVMEFLLVWVRFAERMKDGEDVLALVAGALILIGR